MVFGIIKSALISFIFFTALGFATLDPLAYGINPAALVIISFITLMSAIITAVFRYTLYQTEKRILENRYSFWWLTKLGFVLAVIFFVAGFIIFSYRVQFYRGEEDFGAAVLLITIIIGVPLGVLSASIMPSIFFYKFYGNKKVFRATSILFLAVSFILGAYYTLSASTCEFNKNYICIADRAILKHDDSLCEKTKDISKTFSERSYCYLRLSSSGEWNDIDLCDKLSSDQERYYCMANIAVTTNNPKICEAIQSSTQYFNKEQCFNDLKWRHTY